MNNGQIYRCSKCDEQMRNGGHIGTIIEKAITELKKGDDWSEDNIYATILKIKKEVNRVHGYDPKDGLTFVMDWTRDIQYQFNLIEEGVIK